MNIICTKSAILTLALALGTNAFAMNHKTSLVNRSIAQAEVVAKPATELLEKLVGINMMSAEKEGLMREINRIAGAESIGIKDAITKDSISKLNEEQAGKILKVLRDQSAYGKVLFERTGFADIKGNINKMIDASPRVRDFSLPVVAAPEKTVMTASVDTAHFVQDIAHNPPSHAAGTLPLVNSIKDSEIEIVNKTAADMTGNGTMCTALNGKLDQKATEHLKEIFEKWKSDAGIAGGEKGAGARYSCMIDLAAIDMMLYVRDNLGNAAFEDAQAICLKLVSDCKVGNADMAVKIRGMKEFPGGHKETCSI